jgi:hypothetical protein
VSIKAVQPRPNGPVRSARGTATWTRVLEPLEANRAGGLTIAALRERGIGTPAMSVYELQLAGYEIERVPCEHPDGHTTLGYELRAAAAPAINQSTLKEVASDEISR